MANHAFVPKAEPKPSAANADIPTTVDEMSADRSDHEITIRVSGRVGGMDKAVCFKMFRESKFRRLMDDFCQRNSLRREDVRFFIDGERVRDGETPNQYEMEDQDIIEVLDNSRYEREVDESFVTDDESVDESVDASGDDQCVESAESVESSKNVGKSIIYNISGNIHCVFKLQTEKL